MVIERQQAGLEPEGSRRRVLRAAAAGALAVISGVDAISCKDSAISSRRQHPRVERFALTADCRGIGLGTDMGPAVAALIRDTLQAEGDGAVVELSGARRRIASPQFIDLGGRRDITIDLGMITPDAEAMTAFTFVNGTGATIRANVLEGGRFAGYGAAAPYVLDYGSTENAIAAGGAEAIKIAGLNSYTLDIAATNYAGRVVQITARLNSASGDHRR